MDSKAKAARARAFLQSYDFAIRAAERAADDYARAHSAAARMTATFNGASGSGPSQDRMQDAAIEMMRHADDLAIERDDLTRMHRQRAEVIRRVSERNALWGEVLAMLYMEGMTCEQCRAALARDRRHPYARSAVYKLRDRALEKACDAMEELGYR